MAHFRYGIVVVGILLTLVLTGCQKPTTDSTKTEVPNPAAKNCQDLGYETLVRTNPDGSQTGYCILPNGTECEQWKLFRGECP